MAKTRAKSKSLEPKEANEKTKQIAKHIADPPLSAVEKKPKRKAKKMQTEVQVQIVKEPIPTDYSIQFKDKICRVKIHQQYEIGDDHKLYKNIKNLYILFNQKEKKRNYKQHTTIPYSNFPTFQFWLMGEEPAHNKCSICQFQFEDKQDYEDELVKEDDQDIISLACSHLIHKSCFRMLKGEKQWIKCPVCSSIYGTMIGDQPPGTMSSYIDKDTHCDGFPDVGTIIISYSMSSGTRGNIHFTGTHRTAYLPDNKEGNQVFELLKEAFNRKLIFTVGRSVTTGRDNQVVWNGIHHKTHTHGGSAYFGYPDATYFKRIKQQLAAKGIY